MIDMKSQVISQTLDNQASEYKITKRSSQDSAGTKRKAKAATKDQARVVRNLVSSQENCMPEMDDEELMLGAENQYELEMQIQQAGEEEDLVQPE
jgi:hypothetical protein